MSEVEHYGLQAQFQFVVDPKSRTDLSWVRSQLGGIETAVESLSSSLGNSNIASQFKSDAAQTQRATGRMTSAVDQMGDAMRAASKRIDPLKREFRALRSEVRLVDFGDITDDRQFKKATNEVRTYITLLQRLEGQIRGDTTAEREFTAQLKQQQRVMATRIEMQEQQRIASKAAARVGEFQVVQQAGQLLVNDQLIGQAKDAINVFASFDDKMAGVAAITTATGDSLDSLREKAKYLGATTRFTASEAADAMSFLGMAGFKTEAILSGVQATLDLASAGQLDLASSADISSNVLSGMQLKVEDLGHVTDVMAKTATSANTNIQQLGVAMSYAAPNAAMFGATIEETSALIGVMSNAGVQADKAGTATRAAFIRMASPLKDGKVALQELGITLTDEAGNMRNVIEIFNELNNRLKISPDTLKSIQDAGEDIESLGEVSQSKQIQYLKGIFGTTGISGAAAALGQIGELNRLAIATRASSSSTEQLIQYFTELRGLKLEPGQDIFAAIVAQAPSYTDAVRQIDEANLTLMQVNLKTLNSLDSRRLTEYFQQVKGISVAPGQDLLGAVTANAPDTQAALNQISTAMGQLGIEVKGQVGAARLMAQVMEDSLPGSIRAFGSAVEAVKVNFVEPLKPLIVAVVDAGTKLALFFANLPAPVRSAISVGAALTLGMGALAIAVGAAGVTLFGFQQAMAVTNLASVSLASNLIPLTGFFDTAQKAIVATNPLETFFQRNTQLAGDFERAATGTFDETLAGMKVLARQSLKTGQAFLIMSRSLLLSPIGLSIGGFLLLNTVLEQVVPGFNLLGTVLGAIAAPFGFVYGLLKGIAHSLMDFLGLTGSGAMGAVAPIFGTITNAIELAAKSFSMFAESGERIGEQFGQAITVPFVLAGQVITTAWSRTIGFIRGILRPFADFVQHIGQLLISFLAEASPGPTYWIRTKWAMTVQYLRGLFEQIKTGAIATGQTVVDAIGNGFRRALDIADFPLDALDSVLQQFIPTLGRLEGKIAGIGKVKRVLGGLEEAFRPLTSILDPQRANTPFLDEQSEREARRANALNEIAISAYQTSNKLVDFAEIATSVPVQIQQAWIRTVQTLQGVFNQIQGAAAAAGQQLSDLFASILPQLPGAISIATVLAELSGIINPVEGLAIAIGNTIFGGIVESMGKSLDEVIPIFIRRFSLIAAFGGFLAQRLNFIQPLQARLIAAVALVTGLSTFYFRAFSLDVSSLWHRTIDIIKGDLQSLAGVAKNVGLLLVSFLAEASPGPTYWIRTKWAMTAQFLQNLFVQIRAAASLVNQAFLGIGDVTSDQQMVARQTIFENVVLTLVSGVKSLFYVGQALTWVYDTLQSTVASAIANFDLLSFSLLTVASLPATMVPLLREGFERVIPELMLLAGRGLPRAIVFGLPGAIALATSSGLVKGFEQGFANFLAGVPARSAAFSQAVYGMFNQGLKNAVNQGLSEGVTAFVRAMPSDLGGRTDFTFNFDFDTAYAAYEEQRNARVIALVNYLKQVGDVAREVGAQLQVALAPILSFQLAGIPVIPFFSVILPFRDAVLEVAASPAVQGFIGFLGGTVLPTVARTLAAIATTVAFIFNTFVTLPVAAAINVLTREAVGAIRVIVQAGLAFVTTIPALLAQAVVGLAQRTVSAIALLLTRIPYIGEALSQAFLGSVSFLVATSQVYFQLLARSFQRFAAQINALIGPAYRQVAQQIFQGIVYAFEQGIRPVASILTNLFVRVIDPRTAFRFLTLYFRTGGFRQVFKPGLFSINPIDLLFGGMGPLSQALTAGFKLALGVAFPANIISSKQAEVFQILADPLSKAKSARFGLMVKLVDIVESLPPALRPVLELLKGLMLISPIVQIIGRLAIATMFWYSILKPLNPEIYQAIENTRFLGMSLSPIASLLRVMRFVFVDMGEALIAFGRAIPPFVRATQQLFDLLGTSVGVVVHEAVGISSILLNIFKATFGNLFLVVAIGFAEVLDIALINLRNWATFLRLKTQQYGDAIVAALHGHFGPLVHQVFSDIAQAVTIVFQRTVAATARAIASLAVNSFRVLVAIGDETIRFIRDPFNETIRLTRMFQDWTNRTFGNIVSTLNTYIQQLQLDRLARFLGHFWIQIAAIADVLLLVLGVLNPMQFMITTLIGLGLFLINEYRTGFQTLDTLIAGLAHPIEFVTNAINAMVGALGVYIPPELTQLIAGITEQFVKSLPIITGGVFLLALLIRKNIGQAFQDVVGGVMKIVSGVVRATAAMQQFGGSIRDVAGTTQNQVLLGEQVHKVRARQNFLGLANPFAYSQDKQQQERASLLGEERVAKSKAALKYQTQIEKALEQAAKFAERDLRRMATSKSAYDRTIALGGKIQSDTGFSYDVAPLLEKRKNRFGVERLELSDAGRVRIAEQAREEVYRGSGIGRQVRSEASESSGLAKAYQDYGGRAPSDDALRALAKQSDYGVTSMLEAFQKAMRNLHVAEFTADALYVTRVSIPQNLPTDRPHSPEAFDVQLAAFRKKPNAPDVIKNMPTTAKILEETARDKLFTNSGAGNPQTVVRSKLDNLFKISTQPNSATSLFGVTELEEKVQGLLKASSKSDKEFAAQQRILLQDFTEAATRMINRSVAGFNQFEQANIDAYTEAELAARRAADRLPAVAVGADVIPQAIRNITGQTDELIYELGETRRSILSSVFGFTGVPQLLEQFQSNRNLYRRTAAIAREAEALAAKDAAQRAITQKMREQGLRALMSNAGSDYDNSAMRQQFYADREINAKQQEFLKAWIEKRSFKVDISHNQAFSTEIQDVVRGYQALTKQSSVSINNIDDIQQFHQTLNKVTTSAEKQYTQMFKRFVEHGAAQDPKGLELSYADRDRMLVELNNIIKREKDAFGIVGRYQDIAKANLKQFRSDEESVNKIISHIVSRGDVTVDLEDTFKGYEELQSKLGLGGRGRTSLRQIHDVPLNDNFKQVGVNIDRYTDSLANNFRSLSTSVDNQLLDLQVRVEQSFLGPTIAQNTVGRIRQFYGSAATAIDKIYETQKQSIGNYLKRLEQGIRGTALPSRLAALNKRYQDAQANSLSTTLQQSKSTSVRSRARGGILPFEERIRTELTRRQQFDDNSSNKIMETLMRGAMSPETVRAMLQQELRQQGVSAADIPAKITEAITKAGNKARYDVSDILKLRGLDSGKVSKALEEALSLAAGDVKKIVENPNYTARAVAPFQLFLVKEVPGIIKDAAKGFAGTINRFGGGAIARLGVIVARDITVAFKGDFLNVISKSVKSLSERLGVGANELAVGMERIVGRNPFSDAVRRFSDFLRARGRAASDFLKAQALAPDDTRSLTKLIKNRTVELFKAIGSTIQAANASIQAQGGGIFGTIRALFGGLKGFFGKLFNRQQNSPLAQLDAQIQQQRDRAAKARELQRRAETTANQRTDPFGRDSARRVAQQQYDIARQADAQAKLLQRQRDQREVFSSPRFSSTGGVAAEAVGKVMGRIGGIYEKSAAKLGQRVTELRGQYTGVRRQEIATPPGMGQRHTPRPLAPGERVNRIQRAREQRLSQPLEAQPRPEGGFFDRNLDIKGSVASFDEYMRPLTNKVFTKLTEAAHASTLKLSNYFQGAATRSQTAWERSANAITGKSWFSLVKRAVWTGVNIVANLNHGAADVTAAAWNRTEQTASQDMRQMAETAQGAGQQISQSMQQASQKSTGFLSHLGNSIGKVGKAGMAIGAGITATGFGLQTAAYSLSTMGLISEETSQQLNKFFEIFTLIGAAGGILTPLFTALASSLGAIGSIALAAGSGIAAIGGAIAPLVGLGGVAFAPLLLGVAAVAAAFGGLYFAVRTNFLGIGSIVRGVGGLLGSILSGPISFIESAWQGFVDRFGPKLMPIIQPALDIAQGLINALNHNPTLKIPAAWDVAGERIKGVLDSVLGAGQAVGSGLVAFFTPIVSLFNPIARLFGKRDEQKQKPGQPEVATASQEKPEQGMFGSIMSAITSLVMLPVNLVKGIADWIGNVVGGIVKQIIGVLIGPVQWVADALRPLQMPIAMIELFFKNLVSIVQSVIYLNAVMRPLAANAIGINATINEIAKFFYTLRSLVESAEFLYYHVLNRKALAQGAGQGGKPVDPNKLPSNYRGTGAPQGYEKTGGKAIQDLTLGEAAGEVVGIGKNIWNIKSSVGDVFGGFKTGLNWLGSAWQFTMGMIKGETGTLVADAEVQGYNLQKNLSEGSPGPTYWIRQNWEKTTKALQGWMNGLSGKAEKTGQDITSNLTPGVAALFLPGLSQASQNFGILAGDMADFTKRSLVALATLNFGELSDAVKDFGGNFAYATTGILAGFKQMGGGAIAFGLSVIASISPFLVILGGVAFVAAVIVANFLGLRTILGGAFRIGIGLGQILIAVIGGIVNVGRSLGMIVGGVFLAMRGDFTLLDQGIAQFKASFQEMGRGVQRGFRIVQSGLAQILRGIQEGIAQIFPMFPEWVSQLKQVARAFRDPERAGEIVAEVLVGAFNRIKIAITGIPTQLRRIPSFFARTFSSITTTVNGFGANLWSKVIGVYDFLRTLTFKGIVGRLTTEFRGIPQLLGQIPRQLLTKLEQAVPILKAPFEYIRGFVRGFVRRLAAELPPDMVQAVSTALSAGAARIRLIFTTLSAQLVSIFRQLASKLGLEERFNRMIQGVSDRWNRFAEWIKQGSLFSWVPRTTQEFSDFFVSAITHIESAWNRFTQWLSNTPLFSKLFTQLEQLSRRFTQGTQWLSQQWFNLQVNLAVPTLFSDFFSGLRNLESKFVIAVRNLQDGWEWLAKKIPGLPLFEGVFGQLYVLGMNFEEFVNRAEKKWVQFQLWLSQTNLFGDAIGAAGRLGQVFTSAIQYIQSRWQPFVESLSTTNLFSNSFDWLRRMGAGIPAFAQQVQVALQDIPGTAQKVFDKLIEIATGAITKLKNLFGNIFGTQKLGAIDEQINIKKSNLNQAQANLGNAFDSFSRSQAQQGVNQAQSEIEALLQQRAQLTSNPLIAAVDRIQERWRGFASSFKSILEPITEFARWVAQKLISALNCHPTIVIPTAWDNATSKITSTLQLLIEPFRRIGRFIVTTFAFALDFVKSLFQSFYEVIAPGIERVFQALRNIRKGAAATGELSRLTGIGASLTRLQEALDPLYQGLLRFVEGLRLSTTSGERASGAAQVLGRTIGKVTLFFLEFAIQVTPPLLRVLKLVIGFAIEVVAFAAKVAYALRFLASYFTRVGFAAADGITNVVRFFRSAFGATEQIRGAFSQLQADVQKFVVSFNAGMADLGRALRRLVGAFLDVFAPELKPVLKSAIAEFESFASLVRFALVDLISTTVERMQGFYQTLKGLSPFQMVEQGVQQVKGAIASLGQTLQNVANATGLTQALVPIVQLLQPVAQWLGITSKNTQDMGQAFKESGVAISSTLNGLGSQIQEFFGGLTTRAREAVEPFVVYFRTALDELGERIRTSFPFQVLESGFKQVQEISAIALSTIQSRAERVGAAFRQVLITLNLDIPFDKGVAAARNFGNEVVTGVDRALLLVREGVEQSTNWMRQQFITLGDRITDVIAQVVAQIYVKLVSVGDGFRAIAEQAISQVGMAFDSVQAFAAQALRPYAPIIEALGEVFGAIRRIGGAITELIADFSIFGLNVGTIIGEVILSFGRASYAIFSFAGKVLTPVGLIGIATATYNIGVAIKDLIANVGALVSEAIPALGRLGAAIKETLEAPLNAIASLWTNTIGKIQNAVTGLSAKSQVEGEQIAQGVGEAPARKSWQFWRRTTQAIQADVQALSEELKVEGHEIQAAISEGSPGTTQRIRMFWAKTVDFVGEQVRSLSQVARMEGAQINEGLTNATGGINTSGLHAMESGIEGVSERNQKLAHTAQSLFTSLGSALSNFAPQLAMPLFMVNDFINAFFDIKRAIPDVWALIQGTETVAVASNAAIAVSEAAVAQAAGSSAIVLATGATEAGAAKAAEAAVVGGANSWMAVTYGFLANAAQSAYRSMIVPLIPFLPMILGISVGIFLLYKAFQTNFSGIGDAVKGVADVVTSFFGLLFSGAWQAIASIFLTIEHQIRAIGRTLGQVGNILMEPFRPLFVAFGISGQRGLLGNAVVATVNLILLPLKLVAGAINLIINLLGGFIQGVILIGGVILNFILLPVRLINAAVYGVMMAFNSIMLGISSAINHFLVLPLSIADAVARQIGGAIAAVGRAITNFILRPFFAVENAIMRTIEPVVDFVLRSLGFIAGAAALIFTILSPGVVIGTFVTFITGASLAAKAIQFVLGIPLKAIEFVWRNTVGRILSTTQGFVETTKGLGDRLKIFLSDPTVAIRENWQATVEFIQAKLSELGITAKDKGQEMSQALVPMLPSAASPRPGTPAPNIDNHLQTLGLSQAPQDLAGLKQAYRASARAAHPDMGGDVEQFHRVQSAYEQVKASMETPPRSSVVTGLEQATKKVGTLSDRMRGLSSGFSSSLSSMGAAIANFSPQLAAPFFILGDFINAIVSVEGLLPGLKAFFAGKKVATVADAAVTTVANGAITSSNLLVAGTAASTALVVTTGAETSALAVATEATAVGGANTFMATTFGMVANAARWAYTSILAPLIPLLPAILTVVAVVGLLYLAFKTNFLGIGDIVRGVVGGFLLVFGAVWGVITGIGQAIAQVFGSLFTAFGDILNAFRELGTALFQPFLPLLGLFGGGGNGGGSLGDAINATVSLILAPIKFVADALSLIIRAIAFVVVGVIRLGTAIANTVLKPIANVLSFLNPVFSILRTIAGGIVGVIAGVVTLIGLIGFAATTLIPLIMTGMTAVFGMVVSGMTFLVSAALPMLIQGLVTVATVAIPLMINAFLFVSTVAIPAIVTGLTAIATTAIPLVMAGMSALIPFVITGFGFIVATVVPALIAGFTFIATVAVPAVIAGIAAIATATIPLLISLAPIIVVVLAIVAAVWLLKVAFDFVVGAIQKVAQWIGNLVGTIGQFFQGLPFIGGLFGGTPSRDANTATNIQQFAGGGLVKGSGDAGIPVIAHAGEFVVTTEATQANLGVLEYLNAGGQLALPTPTVGIMPPVPLALPTPVAVPAGGAGSGSVVIENVNLNFEVQINTNNGTEAGEEFLRYIEDPRFKRAVRQSLREMVERTK